MSVRTWSVAELCAEVEEVVAVSFPDQLWVRGEIQGLKIAPRGHMYFDLVDPGDSRGRSTTRLPVTLFAGPRRGVEAVLRKVGDLRLEDGVAVRIRGRLEYYPPQGRVQFRMDAVDPRYTLGQLAADRDRILRMLALEGLLERNASLPLPLVPLRLGLVTSDDSAAFNDVLAELERSGLGFDVVLADARVQGVEAVDTLCAALGCFADGGPAGPAVDAVLVVRGGGARTDLLAFDDEQVARAIARLDVPVITGIGHEIDRSVADEVANTACKTPTAAAGVVIERVREFLAAIDRSWAGIADRGLSRLRRAEGLLTRDGERLRVATSGTLEAGLERAAAAERRLVTDAGRSLTRRDRELVTTTARVSTLTTGHLTRAGEVLDRAVVRLDATSRRVLERADDHLVAGERFVGAVHPDRVLARGYAVVRDADGSAVRRTAALAPGDDVAITLADGSAGATIVSVDSPDLHDDDGTS